MLFRSTPPGFTVQVRGELKAVAGRKLTFALTAHDGVDQITAGTHERFIINAEKFNQSVTAKQARAGDP